MLSTSGNHAPNHRVASSNWSEYTIIMSLIKSVFQRIIFGVRANQNTLVNYLKKNGAKIGEDLHIFQFRNSNIDILNPHLITIGNHVNLVGTTILTHDYSWSVIKGKTGQILGNQKPVCIGNNVFIGDGSIILGGTIINDNVIIGARSVVSGYLEGDAVYAGVPCKKIMSLEEYIKKREKRQFEEAATFVKLYLERNGKIPSKELLHEYFFLFENKFENSPEIYRHRLKQCGTYDMSLEYINKHVPICRGYDEFISSVIKCEDLK